MLSGNMIQTGSCMKKNFIIILVLLFQAFVVKAQLLENKLNIHLQYNYFQQNEGQHVDENGFISPSLFANMKSINAFSLKGVHTFNAFMDIGAGIDQSFYSSWELAENTLYSGSKINEVALYPIIQFHPAWKERGIFNRLKPNIRLSPLAGMAFSSFVEAPFDVQSNGSPDLSSLLSSRDFFMGIKGAVGIEFILNQSVGISTSYGIRNIWISPTLYNDLQVLQTHISAGFYFRFLKEKRFYY